MSIITTWPAVPSRLFAVYASLADSENGETRDRFASWATPSSLASRGGGETGEASSAILNQTLQEARRLGLVNEVDGRLMVGDVPRRKTTGGDREPEFRSFMRHVLLSPERAEAAGHAAFAIALAWFLGRDPRHPLEFSQAPQRLLSEEIGELASATELTNADNYRNFLWWVRYLGYATFVGHGSSRRVVPDPTRAIDEALPEVFDGADALEIEQFIAALAATLPVLEDGAARTAVENARAAPSADRDNLSIATSLALLRLSERGTIRLESVADARARILNYGSETVRVSRVRRGKK